MRRRTFWRKRGTLLTVAGLALFLAIMMLVFAAWSRMPPVETLPTLAVSDRAFIPTMQAHTGSPVVGGNAVEILLNGDRIFPAKMAAIRGARSSITYAEYFYSEGPPAAEIAAALAERCRAGIVVKVLLDGVGALSMEAPHRKTMEAAGCHVVTFRPIGRVTVRRHNNRNHRRILVVDGRIGITGGSGVSWKWTGNGRRAEHWRDTDVRLEGPVVEQLQAAFAENWLEATGEVLGGPTFFPGTTDPRGTVAVHAVRSSPLGGDYGMYTMFLLAISGARQTLSITNPYFLPEGRLGDAIVLAAQRGVRVRVLVPGVIDHAIVREAGRRHFGELLRAGVQIFEYTPALLHSKTMVVDGQWATIGSTNLDRRSFAQNEEMNVAIYDTSIARELDRIFAADLEVSRRITYEAWQKRPLRGRLVELIGIPLRPLL